MAFTDGTHAAEMRTVPQQFDDTVAAAATGRKRPGAAGPVRAGEAGLTLVEMIVVLAIIALVAALIVPNVISRPDQARVTTTNQNLATISQALTMYRLDNGQYPSTQQGLAALVSRPSTPPVPTAWSDGGYLNSMETNEAGNPLDAWGNPYTYVAEQNSFSVGSLGADGQPGGEGNDADIIRKR